MKSHTSKIICAIIGLCFAICGYVSGQTIWNGPSITFNHINGTDPTQPTNQDRLAPDVWITRGATMGIYNAAQETGFNSGISPVDTEWADGTTANLPTSFTNWDYWAHTIHGGPPNTVGIDAVVHLISDNIYLNIRFTFWGMMSGGFTYIRATPGLPPAVSITSPANGASFTAPAIVPITATATDPNGGSITNVAFFDGTTFLAQTNNPSYTVTATFAAGSHPLTAVATDDAGLSTTSAVVTISAGVANTPPNVTLTNPPNGSVFGNTDPINIGANVSSGSGTVTNVQFLGDRTNLLRSFSGPPFNFTTGQFAFAVGVHDLTAVAIDTLGSKGTSAPVQLTIARYTPEVTDGTLSLFLLPIATNLAAPLYGVSPPGDTHRLFVLEQNGLVWIIQDGILLPTAALDLRKVVSPPLVTSNPNDERGLLGMAFNPGYNNPSSPGYRTLYTYNSEMIPSGTLPTYPLSGGTTNLYKNSLNEWKISSTNADIVDTNSLREIISFGKNALNHNGGTCTFGPDGYMYLALGDGGNANDVGPGHIVPGGNAQNLSVPLGKMLRIDPLNPALNPNSPDPISPNGQYRIPTNNPYQSPGQVPEIYAYGFRNPFRFDFDPVTGDLIEADVGQNNIEEINRVVRGGNYGWAVKEGDFLFNMTNGPAGLAGSIGTPPGYLSPGTPPGLTDPISGPMGILEYDHNNGISITGGFVYRGKGMPELYGKYIFGDLALIPSPTRINGRLFYADLQTGAMNVFILPQFGSEILPAGETVHGFGQDGNGEIYAMATDTPPNGNGGVVYKLVSFRLNTQLSGNQVTFSWPVAGPHLQVQTNSLAVGISTNWVNVAGSTSTNQIVVPFNPGVAFYRLASP
ncbi:MAG TPA: PQQ-dependent sugar dehydrogenase [Verrucomicrobiae bacterium]|jgi:glucose/arabinose dehydrogenase|nr:PQQ-dependent sugar dehydrogenase [Verrucomicrobiae bacterium]